MAFEDISSVADKLSKASTQNKEHEDEILSLIESGASLDTAGEISGPGREYNKYIALLPSSAKGFDRVVEKILGMEDMDISTLNASSQSPVLNYAVLIPNNERTVSVLLAAGVSLDEKIISGTDMTAEDMAREKGRTTYATMIAEERTRRHEKEIREGIQAVCDRGTSQKRIIRRRTQDLKT